jgi:very-short-patch-repair endonuclease
MKEIRDKPYGQNRTEYALYKSMVAIGLKPKPQYKIDDLIADFAFPKEMLVIEVNGPDHYTEEGKERDRNRWFVLNDLGWKVRNFRAEKVHKHPDFIAQKIKEELDKINGIEVIEKKERYLCLDCGKAIEHKGRCISCNIKKQVKEGNYEIEPSRKRKKPEPVKVVELEPKKKVKPFAIALPYILILALILFVFIMVSIESAKQPQVERFDLEIRCVELCKGSYSIFGEATFHKNFLFKTEYYSCYCGDDSMPIQYFDSHTGKQYSLREVNER